MDAVKKAASRAAHRLRGRSTITAGPSVHVPIPESEPHMEGNAKYLVICRMNDTGREHVVQEYGRERLARVAAKMLNEQSRFRNRVSYRVARSDQATSDRP
jgi:hypothetical protein